MILYDARIRLRLDVSTGNLVLLWTLDVPPSGSRTGFHSEAGAAGDRERATWSYESRQVLTEATVVISGVGPHTRSPAAAVSASPQYPSGMPSYLVLARKYRPTTFGEVVGQSHVIQTLTNSMMSGRVGHAFLFCGVRGVGKTTVARILAKALNCSGRAEGSAEPCTECSSCREITDGISVDVQEIDGASNTSVENIREINENIKYPPVGSPYKIIIIDEVHMISINAFNALLKTLEEPPAHAKFIFATTESHKVPATINSRCQRFNFRTISVTDIAGGMGDILKKEGIDATEDALALVAREAQGSFRDALSLLDQVIAFAKNGVTAEDVVEILGIAGRYAFGRLAEALLLRDATAALTLLHELFQEGYDPEQFVMDFIHYMRNLIFVRAVPSSSRKEGMVDATASEIEELERLAGQASPEELQNLFGLLLRSEGEIKRAGNPWVALEMTILKMACAPQLVDLAQIIQGLKSAPTVSTGPAKPRTAPDPPSRPSASRSLGTEPPAHTQSPPKSKPSPSSQGSPESPQSPPAQPDGSQPNPKTEKRFVITAVTPLPDGTPDEVWALLKDRVRQSRIDPVIPMVMDHGSLISFGPTEVEIGFNKPFYRQDFERRIADKPELKKIFDDTFGGARLKVLTLAKETSLDTAKPYEAPQNGDTDRTRALKQEALDHPLVRAIQREFEDSSVDDIKILT